MSIDELDRRDEFKVAAVGILTIIAVLSLCVVMYAL
jgi:hypothetical protein